MCCKETVTRLPPYVRVEAYFGRLDELRALLEGDVDLVMVGAVKTATSPETSSVQNSCSMPRDERAYLADVIDSCGAIEAITNSRRIVNFRNRLTHEYPIIDDALVWAIVQRDVPLLRRECTVLLEEADRDEEGE